MTAQQQDGYNAEKDKQDKGTQQPGAGAAGFFFFRRITFVAHRVAFHLFGSRRWDRRREHVFFMCLYFSILEQSVPVSQGIFCLRKKNLDNEVCIC